MKHISLTKLKTLLNVKRRAYLDMISNEILSLQLLEQKLRMFEHRTRKLQSLNDEPIDDEKLCEMIKQFTNDKFVVSVDGLKKIG